MKKILLPLLFSLLTLGENVLAAQTNTEPVEIIASEFGLFNLDSSTKPFVPSRQVKLDTNASYGWIIQLDTDKTGITWREEFTLPVKPETWGDLQKGQSISKDGKTSIIERTAAPEQGMIFNVWQVAPGDPVGRYMIKVFIEGKPAGTFEFDVQ